MQEYCSDNGGATLQVWMRSKRYSLRYEETAISVLTKDQILSQDLEQADPTVYEIINRVRCRHQQPKTGQRNSQ